MRYDEGNGDVQFVVSDADHGEDEDLVQPPGFPRLRRARVPLLVAGAAALIAIVAVNVATGPSGVPSAQTTVTVSPSATSSAPAAPVPPATTGRLHCPLGSSCAVVFQAPSAITAAVRRELPGVRGLKVVTTVVHGDLPGSTLLSRRITGRTGRAQLLIEITPAGQHDRLGWNSREDAARTTVTATDHVAGRLVSVRLTAPPGYDLDVPTARRLATEQQLTRLA
ncbi:hypothetical protein [Jatrophihabitans endophyticus]|uniref:hypothetical protein n=1 Tax=Jatrophihabitans endophyticus TaxID=1206085 RepID=UPI0019F4946E|nr:hypothetical protein [Jatrophihabitans endophyticus]MBE7188701.1 hypothetical protein [Jatrophihabitans endophyticus]